MVLAIAKMAKLVFFFPAFRENKGSLGVFRGALGVANFVLSSLYALNSISAIIL